MITSESTHRQFAELVRSTPAAIIGFTPDQLIESWNPGAEALFGYTADEALGADVMIIIPEARRAEGLDQFRRVAGGETLQSEASFLHKSGRLLEVAFSLSPRRDVEEAIVGLCAIAQEVCDRTFLKHAWLEAAERESRRIGQELHDHLCQLLLGAAFGTKALAADLPPDSSAAAELDALSRLINSAVKQTRDIVQDLNPVDLDGDGLSAALEALTQRPRAGIACRLDCPRSVRVPNADAALHAFRIAQEAISNAIQHARCTEIIIQLVEDREGIRLRISDNGTGFDPSPHLPKRIGLESIRYRAEALGGSVAFDTASGRGTRVTLTLPKSK